MARSGSVPTLRSSAMQLPRALLPTAVALAVGLVACSAQLHPVRERYRPGGPIRYQGFVGRGEDGTVHAQGAWTFWYPGGARQAAGEYADGRPPGPADCGAEATRVPARGREGEWSEWSPAGQVLARGRYRGGQRAGLWTTWYENGVRRDHGAWYVGREHGHHVSWHANGQKRTEGAFVEGRPVGVHLTWDEDGALRERTRHADDGARVVVRFDGSGRRVERLRYREDRLDGRHERWQPCGHPVLVETWREGELHGPVLRFHSDGSLESAVRYRRGRREGHWLAWRPDGSLRLAVEYEAGEPVGLRTVYRRDGSVALQGRWSDGRPVGVHRVDARLGGAMRQVPAGDLARAAPADRARR